MEMKSTFLRRAGFINSGKHALWLMQQWSNIKQLFHKCYFATHIDQPCQWTMLILVRSVYMSEGSWTKIDAYLIWLMSSSFETGKNAWLKPPHTHYRRFNAFSSCLPQHQQEIGTVVLLAKSEAQQFWKWRKIRVWPSCVQFVSCFYFG